jgi:hypothetical protein
MTQQLGLHLQGCIANCAKKDGASVSILEQSRARIGCPGERAPNVPEEQASEQRAGKRGTIAHCKSFVRNRVPFVQRARPAPYRRRNLTHDALELRVFEKLLFPAADLRALQKDNR